MHTRCLFVLFGIFSNPALAQENTATKTRFVIGASVPELLHAGIQVDVSKYNQLGISGGVGPSWGQFWPSLTVEHRLYFGKASEAIRQRNWFTRQGGTFFPAGNDLAAVVSIGRDFRFQCHTGGLTFDIGFVSIYPKTQYLKYFPSVRFQFYTYFIKALKK